MVGAFKGDLIRQFTPDANLNKHRTFNFLTRLLFCIILIKHFMPKFYPLPLWRRLKATYDHVFLESFKSFPSFAFILASAYFLIKSAYEMQMECTLVDVQEPFFITCGCQQALTSDYLSYWCWMQMNFKMFNGMYLYSNFLLRCRKKEGMWKHDLCLAEGYSS